MGTYYQLSVPCQIKSSLDKLKKALNVSIMKTDRDEALKKAIKTFDRARELALALGITPQALSQWKRVPVEHVLKIEALTGVSRSELRPDIYPPDA